MPTLIGQNRPNFRISYFRPCKCRPLRSAARGAWPPCPPPAATGVDLLKFVCLTRFYYVFRWQTLHAGCWFTHYCHAAELGCCWSVTVNNDSVNSSVSQPADEQIAQQLADISQWLIGILFLWQRNNQSLETRRVWQTWHLLYVDWKSEGIAGRDTCTALISRSLQHSVE